MFYTEGLSGQLVSAKLFCLKSPIDFTESTHKFESLIQWHSPNLQQKELTTKVLITLDSNNLAKLFTFSEQGFLSQIGQHNFFGQFKQLDFLEQDGSIVLFTPEQSEYIDRRMNKGASDLSRPAKTHKVRRSAAFLYNGEQLRALGKEDG